MGLERQQAVCKIDLRQEESDVQVRPTPAGERSRRWSREHLELLPMATTLLDPYQYESNRIRWSDQQSDQ